jgi:hypothetical protein
MAEPDGPTEVQYRLKAGINLQGGEAAYSLVVARQLTTDPEGGLGAKRMNFLVLVRVVQSRLQLDDLDQP